MKWSTNNVVLERERFTFRNIFSLIFLILLFVFLFNFNFSGKNIFAMEESSPDHDPYVFKFEIETTEDNEIYYVPTQGQVGGSFNNYNWDIDWGDGTDLEHCELKGERGDDNSGIGHNYTMHGSHTVTLTPYDSKKNGWLKAFGYCSEFHSTDISSPNSQNMRDKVKKVISKIYPQMTRNNLEDTPDNEWSYTFSYCTNITMGEDFTFDEDAWENVKSVGDNFASHMFFECHGTSFEMNDIFNLPQNLTSVGEFFACCMFYDCHGSNFTMNKVFNLPQNLTSVGSFFANNMFQNCYGSNFTINKVFNLP
ncbi:MAG: leucine-rich repeat domain-containing protein, partial [Clostridiales bacterium]|nr:leucine-rich repeat domain-containing protein [Clostridiales bacterium]